MTISNKIQMIGEGEPHALKGILLFVKEFKMLRMEEYLRVRRLCRYSLSFLY